jgi:hypothetical protein
MVPALTASAAKTLGVSIISWRSWETLEMTLSSYQEVGLFDFFDRVLLYFQDLGQRDIEIAAKFGLPYGGGPNCGIADGMRNAATELGTDYVLFLENDCPLIETRDEVEFQLKTARQYLESGIIDVMRLRSRLHPGEAFADVQKYLRYYPVRKKEPLVDIRPYRLEIMFRWLWRVKRYNLSRMKGRAIYVEQAAEELFPEVIQKTAEGFWILDSCCADWTNQSVLCRRDFFTLTCSCPMLTPTRLRAPATASKSPERPLKLPLVAATSTFKIGQGKGLFTHRRVDGSWRKEHPAFEGETGSGDT